MTKFFEAKQWNLLLPVQPMMYIPTQLIGAPVDTQVENIYVRQELNNQHIQRQPVQLKQLAHLGDSGVHN